MSLDGSFCLHSEFERLIARCPNLREVPKFTYLLNKGDELQEEEAVSALAGVFLHPSYTIPIMGCFRPIARKIVDRVVEWLKTVPNLRFGCPGGVVNLNSMEDRFFIGCEELEDIQVTGVIDCYARRGRFLDLHELASLAFCRVLDLAPFLKGAVDYYYQFGGPPFARVLEKTSVSELATEAVKHLRDVVWTSYRLLLLDPEYFTSSWNWCCFLDLVHKCGSYDACTEVGLARDIRWCGVQILCILLRLPNKIRSFGLQPGEVIACLLRWYDSCWDTSVEKAGWYTSRRKTLFVLDDDTGVSDGDSMSMDALKLFEHESQERCRRKLTGNCSPFLMTSSLKKSFERVVLAVNQKWPVLLYGPAGSGKTALIHSLALESGNQVLSIHMDEQIDGRTLVGSYVCTEQPGEFRWQAGPLTQAVKNGFWVVFENIDQAAADVQLILLPLLEGGSSFTTGHGEALRVAGGFRLFSTITTSKADICHRFEGKSGLSPLWRRVMVGPASSVDLVNIVMAWYPNLEPIAVNLTGTFERLSEVSELCVAGGVNSVSRFSVRDLLKWCKRIAGSGFSFSANGLSIEIRSVIYQEVVDVFAAYAASTGSRLNIIMKIAKMWAIPVPVAETLFSLSKPVLQELPGALQIGRVTLQSIENTLRHDKRCFVPIRSSFHVLERIACAVKWNEAVLLVGETGTGKTTLVQYLASRLGQKLTVLNLSQQSDVTDLLGGFKPMDPQQIWIPLCNELVHLFNITFSSMRNVEFHEFLGSLIKEKKWHKLFKVAQRCLKMVIEGSLNPGTKRKRPLGKEDVRRWERFCEKFEITRRQLAASSGMAFSFVEGAFVTAVRNGEWILLDEVNLAPPETLQRIIGVLDGENGSLCLAENGVVVNRHPNFRMFGCMNPATDAGKRDLPYSLRSKFTEYFVDDVLDEEDLTLFVNRFLGDSYSDKNLVNRIVRFYKAAKKESEERLQDGANQKPQFSLRSLYRALEYIEKARNLGFRRALYDGFSMFFLTLLDNHSAQLMNEMIVSYLLAGDKQLPPPIPLNQLLEIRERPGSEQFLRDYIITKSVEEHIRTLARAAFINRYPVLLQGPTSSGKTSLVQYLAAKTGHEFVRINNHEHTDLQEYLGSYITDATGRLVFHEGVLVQAVRNGHWIVLDELNLAPSDVLEALNRLLDDNRELFVPELRETVCAHPDFMLFATQNPPTFYGGRKMLSRAFRNRFVEIHVDEIPEDELIEILERKCEMPRSYSKKMIEVMKELQLRRQSSKVFAGKHGFITPRDLFRWANRFRKDGTSYEDLARDGYFLLAERLRDETEKRIVQEVLEKRLRVKLKFDALYDQGSVKSNLPDTFGNIVWTKSMQRLYFLVERCYQLKEPVLLVGETGGGKTTVCQLLSMALNAELHILNCHQYTETSDFVGGFYPVRERSRIASDFRNLIEHLLLSKAIIHFPEDIKISSDIGKAPSTLELLAEVLDRYTRGLVLLSSVTDQDIALLRKMKGELTELYHKWQRIFVWQDGPLVKAMKNGDLFLVDEISLADDSVLERLNSVLEPDRKMSLAEKGGPDLDIVTAHDNFFLLATMNPGGDYGKKELSPALRNRFTEIWVPPVGDLDELTVIARRFLNPELLHFADPLLSFWEWFNQLKTGRILTVRDLLAWLDFVRKTEKSLHPNFAFLHGAFLVLLDGVSLGTGISKNEAVELRDRCLAFLVKQLKGNHFSVADTELLRMENYGWGDIGRDTDMSDHDVMECDDLFGIHPFYIQKGSESLEDKKFEFLAPTTRRNVLRVLRAMQLPKPVLLEGSPGVGKTSLISAIGKFSGHKVVRINLSEQTDIMDLLGSDLPIESEEGLQFAWSDGILLQALREGSWVLLDEINLAQQSVLEGLNAILDHRAEVFIPELGRSFKCPSSFRVFACQNPSQQGGGRKGLPKSFLNRFMKVYVDELSEEDYSYICSSLFPEIPKTLLTQLILFNKRLYEETMLYHRFAQEGSPWEFNLRDVIRSCQIIQGSHGKAKADCFLNVVYVQRMRTIEDRCEVLKLYEEVFKKKPSINPYPRVQLDDRFLVIGDTFIKRNHFQPIKTMASELKILPGMRNTLEAAGQCIQQQWLCILVGPTSSGKTSLLRLLAHLTGNVLNEINLSSGTDISELLGSFELYNAYRNFCSIVTKVESYMNEYCSLQLDSSADEFLRERKDLINKWLTFSSNVSFGHVARSDSVDGENWRTSLPLLAEIIELLKMDVEQYMLSVSWGSEDLSKLLLRVYKLQAVQNGGSVPVKFEWAAGLLIKAIENGEWIVLEDANLCNPTVLDRINSLAESEGSITVNECGNVDGRPLVLYPHPNFRMFLTVNPSHGNVSRAMRNRGIEIVMMQPYWLLNEDEKDKFEEIELNDVKRFLALSNIPSNVLVDSMAKSHIHARNEGVHLDTQITYLELGRWVKLFLQLLMTGNNMLWSLHRSWEHSYLSSLGESGGWDIVNEAKVSYLTNFGSFALGVEFTGFSEDANLDQAVETSNGELSLCLPGGWPAPLGLRDFVWNSMEACVKQNCMYLEYLGVQCASHELQLPKNQWWKESTHSNSSKSIYLLDSKMLQLMMYPQGVNGNTVNFMVPKEHEKTLNKKKLLVAADWVMDQVTEKSDIELYLLLFSWFDSQLQPYCKFFSSLVGLLKEELGHPIWQCIFQCRHEILSYQHVDFDSQSVPLLALESVDELERSSKSSAKRLSNAIRSVGLLRCSLWQWNAEMIQESGDTFLDSVMRSLRKLEEEVLSVFIESPSFDTLHQTYADLLDEHILFWNVSTSSKYENLLVHWHALIKAALKLREAFPEAVMNLLRNLDMMSVDLNRRLPYSLSSEKSLLWAYGGHPSLPHSSDIGYKLQQLVGFTKIVWPSKRNFPEQGEHQLVEIAVSTNPELRFLAMQGVCMTLSILRKFDEIESANEKLEEMYEMLLRRFNCEKNKLDAVASRLSRNCLPKSACCTVAPEIMCHRSIFESWMESLPVVDNTSLLLDLLLLQKVSENILVDEKDLKSVLLCLHDDLQYSSHFSINFSSRPPLDMVPHQDILWMLDAWASTHSVVGKIASSVLEMWFKWHSSLWNCPVVSNKDLPRADADEFLLPDMLVKPVKTEAVQHILKRTFVMKDYHLHRFNLRFASSYIWRSFIPNVDVHSCLSQCARSLLQQIIFAHHKSFMAEKFMAINSCYVLLQTNGGKHDNDIKTLVSLLASSRHARFVSLVKPFIEPLLKDLFVLPSSNESLHHISRAWLRLGGLRFNLLLSCDELDPAIKYNSKYLKMVEKCKMLAAEIEVRQHCSYLVGSLSTRKCHEEKTRLLEKLKLECKRLQRKIYFRSDPGKFIKLKNECNEFSENVNLGLKLLEENDLSMNLPSVVRQASNWQETAKCFIDRLSEEYSGYIDIIQPIQVAVYEMKLGITLLMSSAVQKDFVGRIQETKVDSVLDAIYSFMRFPHGCAFERPVHIDFNFPQFPFYTINVSACIWVKKMGLLKKLISATEEFAGERKAPSFQWEASLSETILGHVMNLVANTKILSDASFLLLEKVYEFFSNLWRDVKVHEENQRDSEAQVYKFKPRAFELDDLCEIDVSSLSNSISNDSFTEWKELLVDEESTQKKGGDNQSGSSGDWNLIPESILNNVVNLHNQLFGSSNLSKSPGIVPMSDKDKLHSFINSYTLGATVMKDLAGISASSLDTSLAAEHMLRLCVEHEVELPFSDKSAGVWKFYKDPNPSVVAGTVHLLNALKQRVLSLLRERDEHPGLQKILDIVEMLLALPSSTSVAQALSGLQFLVSRIKILQEHGAKFPLNNELEPILALVSSFQRMEFQTWNTMLDEVLVQFEMNAAKLWFPLYLVLHRGKATDIVEYARSILQSLEDLIRTSNIGEFKRRLQLLLSFYGQLDTGIRLGCYSSCIQKVTRDVLYNVLGFYMQCLPRIMEHIESSTKSINREVEELLKLCQWDRPENLVSMENTKRNRQKLKKLIQKYTEALQQPVMLILTQDSAQRKVKSQNPIRTSAKNQESSMLYISQFGDVNRTTWYESWQKKIDDAVRHLYLGQRVEAQTSHSHSNGAAVDGCAVENNSILQSPHTAYEEEWSQVWHSLENICRAVVETADIWTDERKSQVKTRAFSDLLKRLENSGLFKHKSSVLKLLEGSRLFNSEPSLLKDQLKSSQSSWWFFLPSYDVQHVLLAHERSSFHEVDGSAYRHFKSPNSTSVEVRWRSANQHYFKSLASVRHLQQISLNFHKDFMPDQVNRSNSFLEHLVMTQMEQRAAAYDFTVILNHLSKRVRCFKKLSSACGSRTEVNTSEGVVSPSLHHVVECMWQQKELLDTLCALLDEESLMLKTVESSHLNACQSIKAEANEILSLIEHFVPLFKKSKASLDDELLGDDGSSFKLATSLPPLMISKDMGHLIVQNFQLIRELEKHLAALRERHMNKNSIEHILLSHFENLIGKAKKIEEEFYSSSQSKLPMHSEDVSALEAGIDASINGILEVASTTLQKVGYRSKSFSDDTSLDKITSYKLLFDSYTEDLRLNLVTNELDKIISSSVKLNSFGLSSKGSLRFEHLEELLGLLLAFSDGLLDEFLAVHVKVSMLTHKLAETLASLFTEGYGVPTEELADDAPRDTTQDASGTGMGEGAGMKDVSDQITDEDQLLGNSAEREDHELLNEFPSKNDKGIEMEQDFDAGTFSVSEDSDADDEDHDDNDEVSEQIDRAMGNTGDDSEVVDEKLWNKEEDENLDGADEKNEAGPSVKDKDPSNRELRAKDDSGATNDELADGDSDELDKSNDMDTTKEGIDDRGDMEEINIDKEEASTDHPGFDLNEPGQTSPEEGDEMDLDPANPMEEEGAEANDDEMNNGDGEDDTTDHNNEILETAEAKEANDRSDDDDSEKRDGIDGNMDLAAPTNNMHEQEISESAPDHYPNAETTSQMTEMHKASTTSTAHEMDSDVANDLAPSENASQVEVMLGNSQKGNISDNHKESHMPQKDVSSFQKSQPNPLRDIGDALQDWKERVKVSSDLPDTNKETVDDMMDENADEYGFTSELDKGTAQALGSALPDQIERNIFNDKPDGDGLNVHEEKEIEDFKNQDSDVELIPSCPVFTSQLEEITKNSDSYDELSGGDSQEAQRKNDGSGKPLESLVSVKKTYLNRDMNQPTQFLTGGDELGKVQNLVQQIKDLNMNAGALWRKYELQTARLSQELAEQLRLIMEPTLASKLQGDYRTGKRINMKKVLAFIASHYRNDKIWLKRTKPNKRDYQVVIAVDDSRSMYENCCGDFALEALVTVCRALSQLEVGKLAVTSFGKQGNIRLLHDFDQPLTVEAGMKMISSLTFDQENTLREEPMVDLLSYLNNMLEQAVANARLPSGQNPLQQLVLIIADGRFHDNKEKVKRIIRDVLNKNCMVAFLVLDSAQESIMDCKDYIFKNGLLEKAVPYLDNFPFPYYIVLRNIEALPRTLADLLRQWFEMMQYTRD